MTEAEIVTALTEIFRDIFDDEALVLTPETTADDVDQWDSFNHINILVATEARFGIKFNTAEIEGLKDVGELAGLIARKVKGKA